jgi:hypothetical protein
MPTPFPCQKCGRKNVTKGPFLTIALYPCKCGNAALGFETNIAELTRIADKENHPLYSQLTVNEIVQILMQETEQGYSKREKGVVPRKSKKN